MDAKYLELIEKFPLLPITNNREHKAAKAMILRMTERDGELSRVEVGYAKVLVHLIKTYETSLVGNFFDKVTGADALNYLLNEHKLSQTEAAEIAGISKQNLHDFLKGRRGLTKSARSRLAKHFNLEVHVFELSNEMVSA